MHQPLNIAFRPIKLFILLTVCLLVLLVAHVIGMSLWYSDYTTSESWYYISLFDLDEEESIGTWFNAFVLFISAQLLFLIGLSEKLTAHKYTVHWMVLATGFLILSIDEIAGFHELFNTVVDNGHWTYYGLALVAIVGLAFVPFLLHLPIKYRLLFIVSGFIYLGGALGVELGTISYEENDQLDTLAYNLWNAVEEGMEMFGIILFASALTSYLSSHLSVK